MIKDRRFIKLTDIKHDKDIWIELLTNLMCQYECRYPKRIPTDEFQQCTKWKIPNNFYPR